MKYEEKKKIVINYLKELAIKSGKDWVSPTEIGGLFGGHSSVGSPLCKRMVKDGILIRNEKGHYKLKA